MYNQNNDDPWQCGNGAFNDSGTQHSSAFKEQPKTNEQMIHERKTRPHIQINTDNDSNNNNNVNSMCDARIIDVSFRRHAVKRTNERKFFSFCFYLMLLYLLLLLLFRFLTRFIFKWLSMVPLAIVRRFMIVVRCCLFSWFESIICKITIWLQFNNIFNVMDLKKKNQNNKASTETELTLGTINTQLSTKRQFICF